jgi:hypothetical protein
MGQPTFPSMKKLMICLLGLPLALSGCMNFEEDPSDYQRAQLAWALVLAAALVLGVALLG